jgi:hypothetical protein
MGERRWAEVRRDAYAQLSVPPHPDDALDALRAAFNTAANNAAASLLRNSFALIQNGELRLRQPAALPVTPQIRKLRAILTSSMGSTSGVRRYSKSCGICSCKRYRNFFHSPSTKQSYKEKQAASTCMCRNRR